MRAGPVGSYAHVHEPGWQHAHGKRPDDHARILPICSTRFVDRPVVDLTALKGAYHLELDLSAEDSASRSAASLQA